jgi:hypothetical protein
MAHFFELPVPKLEALVREGSGFSASQWWDIFRGEDKDIGIRTRLHQEIRSLVPKCVFKTQPVLDDLIREIRRQRRLIGLTSPGRAWKWGYRYPARLHLACYFATGLTFQELEMKMLEGVIRTWGYDHTRCTLFRVRQGAPPRRARAPRHSDVPSIQSIPSISSIPSTVPAAPAAPAPRRPDVPSIPSIPSISSIDPIEEEPALACAASEGFD